MKISVICTYCKKEFLRHASHIVSVRSFCSRLCGGAYKLQTIRHEQASMRRRHERRRTAS